MEKEDQPLRNAGKSIAKGAENTTDALSEGRLMDVGGVGVGEHGHGGKRERQERGESCDGIAAAG